MTAQPNPGPFRCLGCRSFVTGTEAGHCPKCGLVPPRALLVPSVEPAIAVVRPWEVLRRIGPLVLWAAISISLLYDMVR